MNNSYFDKAKWIWEKSPARKDEFVDFLCNFEGNGGSWILKISADSDYNVYINGKLASFGQYADYPFYKVYDEVDISSFVKKGNNRMVITVWYYGIETQTYKKGKAGLIFELSNNGKVVEYSSEDTLSRISRDYVSGREKRITSQLGLTYCYNSANNDNYLYSCDDNFEKSRELADMPSVFTPRPVKKLKFCDRTDSVIVRCGSFKYTNPDEATELRMENAILSDNTSIPAYPAKIDCMEGYDGIFIIADIKTEVSGFLDFDFDIDESVHIDIGYGEHIDDGRCRTHIGDRSFTAEYISSVGTNIFTGTFRRFGCRYIQIFVPARSIKLNYLGIRPTVYPLSDTGMRPVNALRRQIYDVCVNTLRQCMHEHYEDCPWREQALYTMDSRNQMLCGYYAFGEYDFARASIMLISKGVRPDGLLSLCYPAGIDIPIPSFSLVYFIQVNEYLSYSGDTGTAVSLYPMLKKLMSVFTGRIDENGLIQTFEGKWNFYEWSDGMSDCGKGSIKRYEAPLNAFLVLALNALSDIAHSVGKEKEAESFKAQAESVAKSICKTFYDAETDLFRTYEKCENYSVLTNSLCVLCGAAESLNKNHILQILAENGSKNSNYVITPNTLSMNSFKFDALLKENKNLYAPKILAEIDRVYGYMLSKGATSFWETIKGADDFGGAGSLCHGWSALPIYYYSILDPEKTI